MRNAVASSCNTSGTFCEMPSGKKQQAAAFDADLRSFPKTLAARRARRGCRRCRLPPHRGSPRHLKSWHVPLESKQFGCQRKAMKTRPPGVDAACAAQDHSAGNLLRKRGVRLCLVEVSPYCKPTLMTPRPRSQNLDPAPEPKSGSPKQNLVRKSWPTFRRPSASPCSGIQTIPRFGT